MILDGIDLSTLGCCQPASRLPATAWFNTGGRAGILPLALTFFPASYNADEQ
jgi:hypothetical protein